MRYVGALSAAWLGLVGCGPRPVAVPPRPALDDVFIVVTERAGNGPRLVGVDRRGDRMFDVVEPAATLVRDSNPAISPDGKWLVFASSRGRSLDATSLWLAPLGYEAVPRPLTRGDFIDTHPTWAPDGQSIVFASTRSGTFDLWRVALTMEGPQPSAGQLTQLTSEATHEVTPNVASDGRIVFSVVAPAGATPSSHLALLTPGAPSAIALTDGQGDSSPAFSPDGERIAFAAPSVRRQTIDGKMVESVDGDIWVMPATGGPPRLALASPDTDEGGPVWSSDGRTLFATSLLRGAQGQVLFSAVIFNRGNATERPRMLIDQAGAVERLAPTLRPGRPTTADFAALQQAPDYQQRLAAIVKDALQRNAATKAP